MVGWRRRSIRRPAWRSREVEDATAAISGPSGVVGARRPARTVSRRAGQRVESDYAALRVLTALLRGERPERLDWMAILRVANHALVTPALAAALDVAGGQVDAPHDVRTFLDEVARRTGERNRRLAAQLSDISAALNAEGIEPMALKGAAFLASPGDRPLARILTDLDLLLAPDEIERAIGALERAGFRLLARYPQFESHVAAELGREQDMGALDLHRRRPGPRHMAANAALERPSERIEIPGAVVRRGSPETRILEIVLHDLFHDGDYWRGALDLRHLIDIADLISSGEADWSLLTEPALGVLGRRAVGRHLIAAHDLLGAPVPPELLNSLGAGLEYRRALYQMRAPALRTPLVFASLLAQSPQILAHYQRERRWHAEFAEADVSRIARARARLTRLGRWLGPPPVGKL